MGEHKEVRRRWEQALSEYWNSNLTVAEYCRRNNLCSKTAWVWVKRLRPVKRVAAPLDIVPVKQVTSVESLLPQQVNNDSGIHLNVGGLHISLAADFNTEALGRVLSLLEVR